MCNAVSTSKWQVQKRWMTCGGDGSRVGTPGGPREVLRQWPVLRAESRGLKNPNLFWCTLDKYPVIWLHRSPLLRILQTLISLPTLRVCVHFYFITIPLFVICWVFAPSVLLENLIFLLLWKWMKFNLLGEKRRYVLWLLSNNPN